MFEAIPPFSFLFSYMLRTKVRLLALSTESTDSVSSHVHILQVEPHVMCVALAARSAPSSYERIACEGPASQPFIIWTRRRCAQQAKIIHQITIRHELKLHGQNLQVRTLGIFGQEYLIEASRLPV